MSLLLIFLGGGLGAISRYALSSFVMKQANGDFPWGTLAVNLLGGFVIGLIIELSAVKLSLSQDAKLLLVTGLLGGFTTFSAFSLETVLLIQRGEWAHAVFYVAASLIGSIALLCGAMQLVRTVS